jgi:phosphate transport system ATP-binding protein
MVSQHAGLAPNLALNEAAPAPAPQPHDETAFDVRELSLWYGGFQALRDVTTTLRARRVTALMGPSGCGKSTLLRCLNRMNDLIRGVRVAGEVLFHGENIYAPHTDAVEVRRRVGMVFQSRTPSPSPCTTTWRLGRG